MKLSGKILFITISLISALAFRANGQKGHAPPDAKWVIHPSDDKAFVENRGQYHLENHRVLFGTNDVIGGEILFHPAGLTYRFIKSTSDNKNEESEDELEEALDLDTIQVHMNWDGANKNAKVIPQKKVNQYYNFAIDNNPDHGVNYVPGYQKLIYKNLYPGIDVSYSFHPEIGLKYELIVQPGANPDMVKMTYSGVDDVYLDQDGTLNLASLAGIIKDKAPFSFLQLSQKEVHSTFYLDDHSVGFKLGQYDQTQTLIIDPWVVTPDTMEVRVLNVAVDNMSNVYTSIKPALVQGPRQVRKYDPTGVPVWVFIQQGIQISVSGDFTVNSITGETFISDAWVHKLDANGIFEWQSNDGGSEPWTLTLNCAQDQLVIGNGISGYFNPRSNALDVVAGTNINNLLFPEDSLSALELRAATFGQNGNYYYLSLGEVIGVCPTLKELFVTPHYLNYNYFGAGYQGNLSLGGHNGIGVGKQFIFGYDGDSLAKYDITNGQQLTSILVYSTFFSYLWSGVQVDTCENVFIGGNNKVFKYDQDLNILDSVSTDSTVFDLVFSPNGDLIAGGYNFVGAYTFNHCGAIECSPQSSFAQASNDTVICANDTIQLVASGGNFYSWFPSDGLSDSTIANPLASPDSSTTYTVLVFVDSCQVDRKMVTVEVDQSAVTMITASPDTICIGDSAVLSADTTIAYYWSPVGSNDLDSGISITVTPSATTIYQFSTSDSFLCSNNITVNVSDPGQVIFNPTQPVVCENDSVLLKATIPNAVSYQWTPSSQVSPNNDSIVRVLPTIATTYFVTITNEQGCLAEDSIIVTIGEKPNISLVPDPIVICQGDSISLTASGGLTYEWGPSPGLSDTTGESVIASPNSTSSYLLIGQNSAGCRDTVPFTVNITPTSFATLLTNDTLVCIDDSVIIRASFDGTPSWAPSKYITPINDSLAIVILPSTDYISVSSSALGFCDGEDSILISVANPATKIDSLPNRICLGGEVKLTAQGGSMFLWAPIGPSAALDSTTFTLTDSPDETTVYQVVGIDTFGCRVIDSVLIKVIDCNIFIPNVFSPNGDGQNDLFRLANSDLQEVTGTIYNRWGQLMYKGDLQAIGWDGTVNGINAPDGTYFCSLKYIDPFGNKGAVNIDITLIR